MLSYNCQKEKHKAETKSKENKKPIDKVNTMCYTIDKLKERNISTESLKQKKNKKVLDIVNTICYNKDKIKESKQYHRD